MPLVIQFCGAYAAPKIVCDYCGEEITTAEDGNYQWSHAEGCEERQTALMYFTHKRCCRPFEQSSADPYAWGAIELTALPHYLMKNLKVSWRASAATARWMSGVVP